MKMQKILEAFSFRQLQNAVTILRRLEREGLTSEDLIQHVKAEKQRLANSNTDHEAFTAALLKCPTCKLPMVLRQAGEFPEDGSHWTCPKCRYGSYDPRPVNEIMDEVLERSK